MLGNTARLGLLEILPSTSELEQLEEALKSQIEIQIQEGKEVHRGERKTWCSGILITASSIFFYYD